MADGQDQGRKPTEEESSSAQRIKALEKALSEQGRVLDRLTTQCDAINELRGMMERLIGGGGRLIVTGGASTDRGAAISQSVSDSTPTPCGTSPSRGGQRPPVEATTPARPSTATQGGTPSESETRGLLQNPTDVKPLHEEEPRTPSPAQGNTQPGVSERQEQRQATDAERLSVIGSSDGEACGLEVDELRTTVPDNTSNREVTTSVTRAQLVVSGAALDPRVTPLILNLPETNVPGLQRLDARDWLKFTQEYDAYHMRGGARSMSMCISVPARRAAAAIGLLKPAGMESDDELRAALRKYFAPADFEKALRTLDLVMTSETKAAYIEYTVAFTEQWELCQCQPEVKERLTEKVGVDMFRNGLRPGSMKKWVPAGDNLKKATLAGAQYWTDARVSGAPSDDRASQSSGYGVSQRHGSQGRGRWQRRARGVADGYADVIGQSQPSVSAVTVSGGDKARSSHQTTMTSVKTCYSCNQPGHVWKDCPQRKHRERRRVQLVSVQRRSEEQNRGPTPQQSAVKGSRSVKRSSGNTLVALKAPTLVLTGRGGERVQMPVVLDTGAQVNILHPDVARKLGWIQTRGKGKCGVVRSVAGEDVEVLGQVTLNVEYPATHTLTFAAEFEVVPLDTPALLGVRTLEEVGLIKWNPGLQTSEGDNEVDWELRQAESCYPQLPSDPPDEMPENSRAWAVDLVKEFKMVFSRDLTQPANMKPFEVELIPGKSVMQLPPRRVPEALKNECGKLIDEMLGQGLIKKSDAPHPCPIVLVHKKDGKLRFCCDFRAVNAVTQKRVYMLPKVEEVVQSLCGKKYFATLDMVQGYHQIPLHENSRKLLAFSTHRGVYEWNVMPFGLNNATQHFQCEMEKMLSPFLGQICSVYVDDIVVFADTEEELCANLRKLFVCFRENHVRLSLKKCSFCKQEVHLLGRIVDSLGVRMDPSRAVDVDKVQVPKDVARLRSFLGMANYYHQFIPNLATLSAPLTAATSSKRVFAWTDEMDRAFREIKEALKQSAKIYHVDFNLPLILRTDASNVGIGATLLQIDQEGLERVVTFLSKKLTPTQQRWSTIELEAFAIYSAITRLRDILYGRPFVVETDHQNLVYIDKAVSAKVVRWRMALQEYEYTIHHIAGKCNVVADALSRCYCIHVSRDEAMRSVHCGEAGHLGINKTWKMLKSAGTSWRGMRDDVRKFILECPVCQKNRLTPEHVHVRGETVMKERPFQCVALDTLILEEDSRHFKYVIVALDCFTRFVELFPTKTLETQEAVDVLIELFSRYGPITEIRTDGGGQFTAEAIEQFLKITGSAHVTTTPYSHEENGMVERAIQEVQRHLRAYLEDKPEWRPWWSVVLPIAQRVINFTEHSTTKVAPARLLYGDGIALSRGVIGGSEGGESSGASETGTLKERNDEAERLMKAAQSAQRLVLSRRQTDWTKQPETAIEFKIGQFVLAKFGSGPPSKLSPRWAGPFEIVGVGKRLNVYECRDLSNGKVLRMHVSRLKEFRGENNSKLPELAALDKREFVVEKIVQHRGDPGSRQKMEFLVHWAAGDETWEPWANVKQLAALDRYIEEHPELARRNPSSRKKG